MITGAKNEGIAHDAATADATSVAGDGLRPNVTRRLVCNSTALIQSARSGQPSKSGRKPLAMISVEIRPTGSAAAATAPGRASQGGSAARRSAPGADIA